MYTKYTPASCKDQNGQDEHNCGNITILFNVTSGF
jgi:hypothetical protein